MGHHKWQLKYWFQISEITFIGGIFYISLRMMIFFISIGNLLFYSNMEQFLHTPVSALRIRERGCGCLVALERGLGVVGWSGRGGGN